MYIANNKFNHIVVSSYSLLLCVYDEYNFMVCTDSRPCPYDSDFRCGDGLCIRSYLVCNRYNTCRDGSDEVNCGK